MVNLPKYPDQQQAALTLQRATRQQTLEPVPMGNLPEEKWHALYEACYNTKKQPSLLIIHNDSKGFMLGLIDPSVPDPERRKYLEVATTSPKWIQWKIDTFITAGKDMVQQRGGFLIVPGTKEELLNLGQTLLFQKETLNTPKFREACFWLLDENKAAIGLHLADGAINFTQRKSFDPFDL